MKRYLSEDEVSEYEPLSEEFKAVKGKGNWRAPYKSSNIHGKIHGHIQESQGLLQQIYNESISSYKQIKKGST